MFDKNLRAELVWDGTDEVRLPSTMEAPAPGQMVGTSHERLGEVSARVCYESMGLDPVTGKPKGRSSVKMHEHLKEVVNYSVYEHCTFTVTISNVSAPFSAMVFINRPGVWFQGISETQIEVTINHRSVLEWDSWSVRHTLGGGGYLPAPNPLEQLTGMLGELLHNYARTLAPYLYGEEKSDFGLSFARVDAIEKKENLTPDQAWVSLYLSMSRGGSHEQVRHGEFSAISQRSSRFCDEDSSPWVEHPLTKVYLNDFGADPEERGEVKFALMGCFEYSNKAYKLLTDSLQRFLKNRGVEGTSARKQARGAARGYLGNALFTDMIFSANVRQWRNILSQRASIFADAEIRNLYAPHVLRALQSSQYGHMFSDMELAPSPDGIGQIVVPTP